MGKVVLVTGGTNGIGRSIALAFATPGNRVAVNYRSDERSAAEVVAEVNARGAEGTAVRADVTNRAHVRSMVETVRTHWGRIDVLVNNAGGNRDGLLAMRGFR